LRRGRTHKVRVVGAPWSLLGTVFVRETPIVGISRSDTRPPSESAASRLRADLRGRHARRAIPRALAAYPGNLRDADGRETLVEFDETRDCRGGGSPCYAAEPAVFTVLRGSG